MKFNKKNMLIIIFSLLLLSGCSTMYFHNGPPTADVQMHSEWHHNLVFRLWEVSEPVDLENRCAGKDWTTVKTERTFVNGVAGVIDSVVIGVDVWDPWTVEYSCK